MKVKNRGNQTLWENVGMGRIILKAGGTALVAWRSCLGTDVEGLTVKHQVFWSEVDIEIQERVVDPGAPKRSLAVVIFIRRETLFRRLCLKCPTVADHDPGRRNQPGADEIGRVLPRNDLRQARCKKRNHVAVT